MKQCVLYDRECIECGECNVCDLDPDKICDNCCKCIEGEKKDYEKITIDKLYFDEKVPTSKKYRLKKKL